MGCCTKINKSPKVIQKENNSPNIQTNNERQRALLNFSFGKLDLKSANSPDKECSSNKKDKFKIKDEEILKKINKNIQQISIPIKVRKKEKLYKNNFIKKNNNIRSTNNIPTKINLEHNIKLIEENFVDNFKNKERSESLKKALRMYNKIKSFGKISPENSNQKLNNSYTSGFKYNKKYSKTVENNSRQKYFIRKMLTEEKYYVDVDGKEKLIEVKHSIISDKENYPLNKTPYIFSNTLIANRLKKNYKKNHKIKSIPISSNNSSIHSFKNKIPHEINDLKIKKIKKCSSYQNINNLKNRPLSNQLYKKKICEDSKNKKYQNQNQTKIIKIPNRKKCPFVDEKMLKRNHSYHEIISPFRTIIPRNIGYQSSYTNSNLINYTNYVKLNIDKMKKTDAEKNSNFVFLNRCNNNSNCSYYESKSLSNNNFIKPKLIISNSQSSIYNKDSVYNNFGYHECKENSIYKRNTINNIKTVPIKSKYLSRRNNSYSNSNYVTVSMV